MIKHVTAGFATEEEQKAYQRGLSDGRREVIRHTTAIMGDKAEAALAASAKRVRELDETLRDVTASLVAAIYLLSRGGKKAAPSDKMFVQMLADYDKSVERARLALSHTKEGENA